MKQKHQENVLEPKEFKNEFQENMLRLHIIGSCRMFIGTESLYSADIN